MTKIRSRKHSVNRYLATVAAVAIPAMPLIAHAQAAEEKTLKEVTVTATVDKYKSELTSPKFTQALVDTPKTVTVITKNIIQEQGATTLMEALRNTPGITMQLGENGNTSSGDTFQMRGFSTQSSLFLDGIRDLGAVTRDTFNIEQIEVAKGPSGSDGGRGSSSGYINLVSKLPTLQDASSLQANLTSEGGLRGAVDVNHKLGDTIAFRLNAFSQDNDVPGRDEVNNSGYGIAPSIAFGLGTRTRLYAFAQHVKQDNVPDGGIPSIGLEGFYNADATIRAGAKVDRENFYGSVNDFEKTEANMLTVKFEHDLNENTFVTNTARYGKTSMDRVLTGINGINPANSGAVLTNPSTWTLARSRQGVDQENEILANQTSIVTSFTLGGLEHDLSAGAEVMYERQKTLTLATSLATTPVADVPVIPAANLYNPNANVVLPALLRTGAMTEGSTTTLSLYAFDTIKLNDQWLINAGFRSDTYSTETDIITVQGRVTAPAVQTIPVGTKLAAHIEGDDTVFSWNVGAVYKPLPNGSIYASIANSVTPPGGANFTLSESATSTANPNMDPQETFNYELGTKWDLLNEHLSLTAAYYRTEHENEIAIDSDPSSAVRVVQFGKRIVEGLELSAVGKINDKWSIMAGIATMETEITDGSTGNNANGAAARWSPDLTGTVWTTYKVLPKLTIGGGARYTSDQKRVVDPAAVIATSNVPEIPAYWVVDAMAAYDFNRDVALRLNVYNLFDEDYISTLNNSGARLTMGQPRAATLSLSYKF
ncbi:catecholate siderophore receptor Fiu [Asticcacaulis machinosus]|uniref:Catecholate siderophore receptor Fiu n=1 Tax=Asticcacaulis machinosus TaxID=2984211 RepID=A0ABT5HK54_9CAUL|nr:catecholate siderophore receptor Fiu [Asticcacaulis machinosus]MDC7676388.1 catecholate siderophore receptor Fiu [Asticcacaulis machinosus]